MLLIVGGKIIKQIDAEMRELYLELFEKGYLVVKENN